MRAATGPSERLKSPAGAVQQPPLKMPGRLGFPERRQLWFKHARWRSLTRSGCAAAHLSSLTSFREFLRSIPARFPGLADRGCRALPVLAALHCYGC